MGWEFFEELRKGRGWVPSEILIIRFVFVATELHPDTIFSQDLLA